MILGLLLIVFCFVLLRWDLMQVIVNYLSLIADDKVRFNVAKLSLLFRNVMIYMGLLMISGEALANYLVVEIIDPIFMWSALFTGVSYFVFRMNSVEYKWSH